MRFYLTCLFVLSISQLSCAQTKRHTAVSQSQSVQIIESVMQRVLPGQRGTPPSTRYSFIFVWRSAQEPKNLFWYSGSDWMSCTISKVHKTNYTAPKGNIAPWGTEYEQERIGLNNIKKGDTLELNPQSVVNAPLINPSLFKKGNIFIVYQTKNKWLYTRVKAIKRAPDLALP